jgi:hypothetical protein
MAKANKTQPKTGLDWDAWRQKTCVPLAAPLQQSAAIDVEQLAQAIIGLRMYFSAPGEVVSRKELDALEKWAHNVHLQLNLLFLATTGLAVVKLIDGEIQYVRTAEGTLQAQKS